jgi:hypothetical protein
MKLLKYVMTNDRGLAPNPFFGICSLALCTPNHMNAKLEVGDWIVGHSSRQQGRRLIYAMQVTRVLDMPTYFAEFPKKHPNPFGTREEQVGDNIYNHEGGRWTRLPSACHNTPKQFRQDQGRPVFLAESGDQFWYFGGSNDMMTTAFSDEFPQLIKDRQGYSYVRDKEVIRKFADWLRSCGRCGLIGQPRDGTLGVSSEYLIAVEPEEQWVPTGDTSDRMENYGTCKQPSCGSRRKSDRKIAKATKGCT